MQAIIQMANTSPQVYRKQKLYNGVYSMKIGHQVILNAVQDIEDIQGQE